MTATPRQSGTEQPRRKETRPSEALFSALLDAERPRHTGAGGREEIKKLDVPWLCPACPTTAQPRVLRVRACRGVYAPQYERGTTRPEPQRFKLWPLASRDNTR